MAIEPMSAALLFALRFVLHELFRCCAAFVGYLLGHLSSYELSDKLRENRKILNRVSYLPVSSDVSHILIKY